MGQKYVKHKLEYYDDQVEFRRLEELMEVCGGKGWLLAELVYTDYVKDSNLLLDVVEFLE